jgi:D-alanine-D-alanine ligase
MRVGFVYNMRPEPADGSMSDDDAEFDSPATIAAIRDAIASHGHDVVGLEADDSLPGALVAADVDVVFNIAESRGGRGREAQVPALLELLDVPCTGSDPVTLGITLDKSLASTIVRATGVATPRACVIASETDPVPADLPFPAVVKPLHEGSSKGISRESIVFDEAGLRERASVVRAEYRQPAFCEEYMAGREITVGLLGEPPRMLPPMEVVFLEDEELPLYSFEAKQRWEDFIRIEIPASLAPAEVDALERDSLAAFRALGCRDVARLDFRLAADGTPYFLECNPLPGLAPGLGDLTFIAEAAGIPFEGLIGEILEGALRRMP